MLTRICGHCSAMPGSLSLQMLTLWRLTSGRGAAMAGSISVEPHTALTAAWRGSAVSRAITVRLLQHG